MNNKLKFKVTDKLNAGDTETTTFGCRANNPDICKNCYVDGVCAFVTSDNICYRPSSKWKQYYKTLSEGDDNA